MEERGQVLPLVCLLVVAAGVLCLGLGRLGGAAVARAQAATAADAAALAGAAAGRQAATEAAAANGGRVVGYEQLAADTRVVVELGGARATARARRRGGGTGTGEPAAGLRAALARAGQLLGVPVPTVPARPGHAGGAAHAGAHARGLAVDVPASFADRLAAVASRAGLCQPAPVTDPVHFELCAHRLP